MKKTQLLILLGTIVFCTSAAFAEITTETSEEKAAQFNGYDLAMKLSVNGKVISSPNIKTKVGETSTITQKREDEDEENFIEVTAIDSSILGNEGIMMTFVVGTIDEDGKRTILSKPQIFAKENIQSEITVEQGGGKENLSLSVLAKRDTL